MNSSGSLRLRSRQPACQLIASSAICGTWSRAARSCASVVLPDPDVPMTTIRIRTSSALAVEPGEMIARLGPLAHGVGGLREDAADALGGKAELDERDAAVKGFAVCGDEAARRKA